MPHKNVVCLEKRAASTSLVVFSNYVNILKVIKNMPHLSNKAHVEEARARLHKNTSYKHNLRRFRHFNYSSIIAHSMAIGVTCYRRSRETLLCN